MHVSGCVHCPFLHVCSSISDLSCPIWFQQVFFFFSFKREKKNKILTLLNPKTLMHILENSNRKVVNPGHPPAKIWPHPPPFQINNNNITKNIEHFLFIVHTPHRLCNLKTKTFSSRWALGYKKGSQTPNLLFESLERLRLDGDQFVLKNRQNLQRVQAFKCVGVQGRNLVVV